MSAPRFKVDPLSKSFVRLIDIMFGLTITQGFVLYRNLISNPSLSTEIVTLILVYATIILSWIGYHTSILHYPYNKSDWSKIRLFLDIIILVLYAYLVFVVADLQKVFLGVGIVFVVYVIDGLVRIREWHDGKVSKPWLSAIFAGAFFVVWYLITIELCRDFSWIFAVIGLVLLFIYRVIRGKMYCPLLVLGIDVDGVLGDQVPPTLDRIKAKGKGKNLSKADITSWDHPIDDTDFTKEIEECLLDKDFVMEMPVIAGSISALEELYKIYHLVIATNRPSETEQYTVSWLKKHFKFHEFINTREVGKDSLELDVLIDDNPENIKSFARVGKKALLFLQPWNKGYADKEFERLIREKKIIRCDGWKKTLEVLIEFKKQCEKKV